MLIKFAKHSLQPLLSTSEASGEMSKLMSRCYRRLGDWKRSLMEAPSFDDMVGILQYYRLATEHNHASYKGWHAWAFMNYEALNSLRQQTPSLQFSPSSPQQQAPPTMEVSSSLHHVVTLHLSPPPPPSPSPLPLPLPLSLSLPFSPPPPPPLPLPLSQMQQVVSYACAAIHGFFKSIALSVKSSLQDTLR